MVEPKHAKAQLVHTEKADVMTDDAIKALFRAYVGIWQTGKVDDLEHVIHPRYVGHPASGDRDKQGLRERILAFRELLPDVRFTVEDQLAENGRVATRMTARATRSSDRKKVVLYGLNISRISDGKIIEEWLTWEAQPDLT
jgi:predicted ester cyclase